MARSVICVVLLQQTVNVDVQGRYSSYVELLEAVLLTDMPFTLGRKQVTLIT